MKIKADKTLLYNIAFVAILTVFVVIVFRLPVNAFIVVMPIFAGIIFVTILLMKDEGEEKEKK